MNLFSPLDLIFPVGSARTTGEVVSVEIEFINYDGDTVVVSWKRKAWYVNASVNAFHMHRGLVRSLSESWQFQKLTFGAQTYLRRYVALCVLNSYVANYHYGTQYHRYNVYQRSHREMCCWWVVDSDMWDWRPIIDGYVDRGRPSLLRDVAAVVVGEALSRARKSPSD